MQRPRQRQSRLNSEGPQRWAAESPDAGELARRGILGSVRARHCDQDGVREGVSVDGVAVSEVEHRPRWPIRPPWRPRHRLALLRMLVQLREDAGVNQTSLARRLGITQSEVSKFERGERGLDVLQLRAWLRALGIEFMPFVDVLDRELKRLDAHAD
jgi:Helix-turn-helix